MNRLSPDPHPPPAIGPHQLLSEATQHFEISGAPVGPSSFTFKRRRNLGTTPSFIGRRQQRKAIRHELE